MLVRSKRREGVTRRRRHGPLAPQAAAPAARAADTVAETRSRRSEFGALRDQAVYTCVCGFVFEAPVSTSVGCPHCGDTQAW